MDQTTAAYSTLLVKPLRGATEIRINRPEQDNSINETLLRELSAVLAELEYDSSVKVVILSGNETHFCTGMDFQAAAAKGEDAVFGENPESYYNLLQQMVSSSKIIIAKVQGKVNAGGIGLVAASDIVISADTATFGLSELLFGLIPACVMPFLIRRTGLQKAQWLALTTQPVTAERAYAIGLADEYGENLTDLVRRNLLRLTKLQTQDIRNLKSYMQKLWIISEETRQTAVTEISSLMQEERIQTNIRNFVTANKLPWDK